MPFGHLGRFNSGVKNMCYADTPEAIDALKDTIREAIIDNVLKNWTDRVGWNYFPLLTGSIVL